MFYLNFTVITVTSFIRILLTLLFILTPYVYFEKLSSDLHVKHRLIPATISRYTHATINHILQLFGMKLYSYDKRHEVTLEVVSKANKHIEWSRINSLADINIVSYLDLYVVKH